jgi:hypothetical protein
MTFRSPLCLSLLSLCGDEHDKLLANAHLAPWSPGGHSLRRKAKNSGKKLPEEDRVIGVRRCVMSRGENRVERTRRGAQIALTCSDFLVALVEKK